MESSIAEFLTRRLASEQPPTRAARRHHARPPLSSPLPSRPSPCRGEEGGGGRDGAARPSHFCTWRAAAAAYLLGLLAMIKCSICSYQCDS